MAAKPFAPPTNLSAHQALGVWIHGDGQGEDPQFPAAQSRSIWWAIWRIITYRSTSPAGGTCELIEPEGSRWSDYQWPYGNVYAIYRESIQHSQISALGLWYTNLPPGKQVTCYLSPIKALPLVATKLINPSVRVGDVQLTFPVEIDSGYYLEFNGLGRLSLVRAARRTRARPSCRPGRSRNWQPVTTRWNSAVIRHPDVRCHASPYVQRVDHPTGEPLRRWAT